MTRPTDSLLLTFGELMRRELGADKLLGHVVDAVTDLLEADRATIYLMDETRQKLVSVAAHLPEMGEICVPTSEGVAGYVARTGKLVNVPYCEEDARFCNRVDETTGYQTQSMLAGPLYGIDGDTIGVLQVLNKKTGIFDDEDQRRLTELATQTATLLEETTLRQSRRYVEAVGDGDKSPNGASALGLDEAINQIIGRGQAMREVIADVRRVAPLSATVLLRGESGTGKGLFARALHHNSARHQGPFIPIDCTTFPEGLMESELFGHERGAFTGAHTHKEGKVAAAQGGTLFLDEIGDLPHTLQGKLLTLLQEHTYCPVGSTERRKADIRIVAATNRPLEKLVEEKNFRGDLYYRLRVVEIELPPLRERGSQDIRHLIEHFVRRAARRHGRHVDGVRDDALQMLLHHDWPGNVRELENCLESAVIFCDGQITPSTLSLPRPGATGKVQALTGGNTAPPHPFDGDPTLSELEARYIAHLLDAHDGNRSACARILDIGRNTLLRKIRRHELEPTTDDA